MYVCMYVYIIDTYTTVYFGVPYLQQYAVMHTPQQPKQVPQFCVEHRWAAAFVCIFSFSSTAGTPYGYPTIQLAHTYMRAGSWGLIVAFCKRRKRQKKSKTNKKRHPLSMQRALHKDKQSQKKLQINKAAASANKIEQQHPYEQHLWSCIKNNTLLFIQY